jgi:hypothetical protein
LAVGVISYVIVSIVNPEFASVWLIRLPIPGAKPDRFGELAVQVQANAEPATVDVRLTEIMLCVQIVWTRGVVETWGVGFTVTMTPEGVPTHELAVGVTRYVTVSIVLPEFTKV